LRARRKSIGFRRNRHWTVGFRLWPPIIEDRTSPGLRALRLPLALGSLLSLSLSSLISLNLTLSDLSASLSQYLISLDLTLSGLSVSRRKRRKEGERRNKERRRVCSLCGDVVNLSFFVVECCNDCIKYQISVDILYKITKY